MHCYHRFYGVILTPLLIKDKVYCNYNSYRIKVYRFRAFRLIKSTVTCLFLIRSKLDELLCITSINNMAATAGKLR
jgi:hypothetical protein